MWHKAWAQLSQCVVGLPAMFWRTSKNHFVYVSSRGGVQGIHCPKAVQGGNLAAQPSCMAGRPDKLAPHAQSSATVPPYSSYKYHGAPPAQSVERVRFSPLEYSQVHSCRVDREVRFWGPKDLPACRESSKKLKRRSPAGIHLGSMEFSELWFGRVRKLCRNSTNSDREPTLEFLWCIRIPACWDTHDITSEWVIYQS
jgi:hypothetical protein